MKLEKIQELLESESPKVKGIIDKYSQTFYLKGENPFMDMQINNKIVCSDSTENYFGFNPNQYELIFY